MSNKAKIVLGSLIAGGCLGFILLIFGCGQSSTTSPGAATGITAISFYSEANEVTPVFVPSTRVTAATTWESGNTMYEIFYTLREFVSGVDGGTIDRSNIYCLLYDVETLFAAMTSEVVALASPQVIVPPFDFGNNITYEAAVNDSANQRAAAMISSGTTTKGIVTWIWQSTTDPNHTEYGVLEATLDTATKDLSVDFIFSVDYDATDTVTDYNNRTKISGNTGTHAFEFVQTIGGTSESSKLVQIVGKGVSQGSGNNFLLKVKSNNNDGFSSLLYLVVSAEANENTLKNYDVSAEAVADPASLPASVSAYKDFVVNTAFFELTDLLTDLVELNQGSTREGTIYLDY